MGEKRFQDIYCCPLCSEALFYTDEFYPNLENLEECISVENYLSSSLLLKKKTNKKKENTIRNNFETKKGVYCGSPSMSCPNFHVVPLCSYTCLPLPLFSSYWECPLCNQKNIILIPEYRQTTAEQERRQEETNISLFPYKAKVSKAIK